MSSMMADSLSKHTVSLNLISPNGLSINDKIIVKYPIAYNLKINSTTNTTNTIQCYSNLTLKTTPYSMNCNIDTTNSTLIVYNSNANSNNIYYLLQIAFYSIQNPGTPNLAVNVTVEL